jgi:hypothetical protein
MKDESGRKIQKRITHCQWFFVDAECTKWIENIQIRVIYNTNREVILPGGCTLFFAWMPKPTYGMLPARPGFAYVRISVSMAYRLSISSPPVMQITARNPAKGKE